MPDESTESVLPELPSWMNLRVFVLGALWAGVGALMPFVTVILDDLGHNEITDWHKLRRVCTMSAGAALAGYVRKHSALLKAPPGTDLVKKTKTLEVEDKVSGGTVTLKTEQVDVKPKDAAEVPKP